MLIQRLRRTLLLISALLFPITFLYLSPVMAVGGTYFGLVTFGLLFWALVLLSAPLLGRSFCAWLCPLGGIQMALTLTLERRLMRLPYLRLVKYLLWAGWLGLIGWFAISRGGWNRIDLMWENPGFPPYARQATYFWLLFTLLPVALVLLLGRRAFCQYLCFFAPLNIIGDRIGRWLKLPALRVRVTDPAACKDCGKCTKGCPMSLEVAAMVRRGALADPECITCGSCAAGCGAHILTYGFQGQEKTPAA